MNFYTEWSECEKQSLTDDYYINSFLYHSSYSMEALENCTENEVKDIVDFLVGYDKEKIINKIDLCHTKKLVPSDILQFSDFDKSTSEITHILKYESGGLTFEDLGYLLISAPNKRAATKYGENQAKVAKAFNLVQFVSKRPIEVKNTNLGNLFPFLNEEEQEKLLSILSLRNPVVVSLIANAKYGKISYQNVASCLSNSTMDRRKNNIKTLVDLALQNIDNEFVKNIII